MFTPTLRCECAQPSLIDTMRKWSIHEFYVEVPSPSWLIYIWYLTLILRYEGFKLLKIQHLPNVPTCI